ncbi:MAG: D-hexose-6-phosphate mutarotase [Campylobacterales bacterium]|nr:D-hexose-6-phosphate mutarotase [Campylobacterales bacterium]
MHKIHTLENGFKYLEVSNTLSHAKIALQGAHIFYYAYKGGENLLWLSEKSAYEYGVAIRGGIPLCWPRFGSIDESLQQHGFARTMLFELLSVNENDVSSEVILKLSDTPESRALWNHRFELVVRIVIGKTLQISMSTKNFDEKELFITQAFHTYFRVSHISNVVIKGLQNSYYLDTLIDEKHKEREPLRINQEVDRVYMDTDDFIYLYDKDRVITLKTIGSASTVVWNPWIEKCSKMSYMDKNAYKEFVCIESANAFDDFILIKSKKIHTLSLEVSF